MAYPSIKIPPKAKTIATISTHVILSERQKYASKADVNTEALNTTKKMPSGMYLGALTKHKKAKVPQRHLKTTTDRKRCGIEEKKVSL